jgi:hypothetical protein
LYPTESYCFFILYNSSILLLILLRPVLFREIVFDYGKHAVGHLQRSNISSITLSSLQPSLLSAARSSHYLTAGMIKASSAEGICITTFQVFASKTETTSLGSMPLANIFIVEKAR